MTFGRYPDTIEPNFIHDALVATIHHLIVQTTTEFIHKVLKDEPTFCES